MYYAQTGLKNYLASILYKAIINKPCIIYFLKTVEGCMSISTCGCHATPQKSAMVCLQCSITLLKMIETRSTIQPTCIRNLLMSDYVANGQWSAEAPVISIIELLWLCGFQDR